LSVALKHLNVYSDDRNDDKDHHADTPLQDENGDGDYSMKFTEGDRQSERPLHVAEKSGCVVH